MDASGEIRPLQRRLRPRHRAGRCPARLSGKNRVAWHASMKLGRLPVILAAISLNGCASSVPDPRGAAQAFADAAARGDSDTIYDMMTDEARAARTRDDVRKIVKDERAELADEAKVVSQKDPRVQATARLRFEDGEEAALELKEGEFKVTAAGALPGGAKTPQEALDDL